MGHGILFVQPRSELPSVKVVKETLQKSETLRVLEAANAADAITLATQEFSGLIVLTIEGKEQLAGAITLLNQQSQAIKRDRTMRVLIFNHLDNPKITKTLNSLGCAEFMENTVSPKALLLKIQRHLKQVRTRATVETDEKRRISGDKAKTESEESLGGSSKSQQKMVEPLGSAADYWTFRNPPDAKRIMGRWLVEITGPGPSVGEWVQIASKEKIRGVSTYEWKMRSPDSPFATPDGAWILVARQVDFIWKINRWRIVGGHVSLTFRKGEQTVAKRFTSETNEVITIAGNSPQALARQAEIEATFSGGARPTTNTATPQEEGDLSLKVEAEKNAEGKDFLDKRAQREGKELSIDLEKPAEGKELSLELGPEELGKELELALNDDKKTSKELQIELDEEEEGAELTGPARQNVFNSGRGLTQGTNSDKVTYEDEEGDGPHSLEQKKEKKRRGAFGQDADGEEADASTEGSLDMGEEGSGAGWGGAKKKKKPKGADDERAGDAISLDGEVGLDEDEESSASDASGGKKKRAKSTDDRSTSKELSLDSADAEEGEDLPAVGRKNVFNSGRGLTQGDAPGNVASMEDFRTGVDAFKPVGVRSRLGGLEAKILDGDGGALSVTVESGSFLPKSEHTFEVRTENLKPPVHFSAQCTVVEFTPSEGAAGGIAHVQLPPAATTNWEKVQDAVAARQMEILRFLRMAKGT